MATSPALAAVCAALALGLIAFSQSGAVFDGDEGTHLVALLLMRHGREPFVDFYYWHEPLYLYIASAWAAIAGDSWRSVRLLSALCAAGSTIVVAALAARAWTSSRTTVLRHGAIAAVFFALNGLVLRWGTMAHNYALTLLFLTLAVAAALRAVSTVNLRASIAAGFFGGAATASTLLVAPLLPVLLLWMAAHNEIGSVRRKLAGAGAAALIPFVPLALLATQAPWRTVFGVIVHNTYHRVDAAATTAYHRDLLAAAIQSPQAWLLAALALCGIFVRPRASTGTTDPPLVSLSAWLLGALAICIVAIRSPVHAVYLVVLAPLLAWLATAGIAALVDRTGARRLAVAIAVLFAGSQLVSSYRDRVWVSEWARIERFAAAVTPVTPPEASFFSAHSFVYFAAQRLPSPGFENLWASEMPFPPDVFNRAGLATAAAVRDRIQRGDFDTLLLPRGDPRFDDAALDRAYVHRAELDRYFVLRWERR